jgi:hypothetical protein
LTTCANCGTANVADLGYCEKCGQPLAPGSRFPVPAPAAPRKAGTNPLAVASLLLGLVSLFPLFGILAVVLGHLARAQIRRSAGRQKGAGLALAGLILGYLWLAFILFLLLVVLPSLRF